jgi:hypothetical protein
VLALFLMVLVMLFLVIHFYPLVRVAKGDAGTIRPS